MYVHISACFYNNYIKQNVLKNIQSQVLYINICKIVIKLWTFSVNGMFKIKCLILFYLYQKVVIIMQMTILQKNIYKIF